MMQHEKKKEKKKQTHLISKPRDRHVMEIHPRESPYLTPEEFSTRGRRRRSWQSCCMTMDAEATRFFALLSLTVFILAFCFYMISDRDPCDTGPLWALIGSLLGFWFDGPKLEKKK
jgi:hypothetical protein